MLSRRVSQILLAGVFFVSATHAQCIRPDPAAPEHILLTKVQYSTERERYLFLGSMFSRVCSVSAEVVAIEPQYYGAVFTSAWVDSELALVPHPPVDGRRPPNGTMFSVTLEFKDIDSIAEPYQHGVSVLNIMPDWIPPTPSKFRIDNMQMPYYLDFAGYYSLHTEEAQPNVLCGYQEFREDSLFNFLQRSDAYGELSSSFSLTTYDRERLADFFLVRGDVRISLRGTTREGGVINDTHVKRWYWDSFDPELPNGISFEDQGFRVNLDRPSGEYNIDIEVQVLQYGFGLPIHRGNLYSRVHAMDPVQACPPSMNTPMNASLLQCRPENDAIVVVELAPGETFTFSFGIVCPPGAVVKGFAVKDAPGLRTVKGSITGFGPVFRGEFGIYPERGRRQVESEVCGTTAWKGSTGTDDADDPVLCRSFRIVVPESLVDYPAPNRAAVLISNKVGANSFNTEVDSFTAEVFNTQDGSYVPAASPSQSAEVVDDTRLVLTTLEVFIAVGERSSYSTRMVFNLDPENPRAQSCLPLLDLLTVEYTARGFRVSVDRERMEAAAYTCFVETMFPTDAPIGQCAYSFYGAISSSLQERSREEEISVILLREDAFQLSGSSGGLSLADIDAELGPQPRGSVNYILLAVFLAAAAVLAGGYALAAAFRRWARKTLLHLVALFAKTVTLMRRRWKSTLAGILVPSVAAILLYVSRAAVSAELSQALGPGEVLDRPALVLPRLSEFANDPVLRRGAEIIFSPDTPETRAIMDRVAEAEGLPRGGMVAVDSAEAAAEAWFLRVWGDQPLAYVEFFDISGPGAAYRVMGSVEGRDRWVEWLSSVVNIVKPNFRDVEGRVFAMSLQRAIDSQLIAEKGGNAGPADFDVEIKSLPLVYPRVTNDDYSATEALVRVNALVPALMSAAASFSVFVWVQMLMHEKSQRVLGMMRVVGVSESAYWLSWFLAMACASFVSVFVFLLCGLATGVPIFKNSNFVCLFLSYYAPCLAINAMVCAITSPFRRPRFAYGFAFFICIASLVMAFMLGAADAVTGSAYTSTPRSPEDVDVAATLSDTVLDGPKSVPNLRTALELFPMFHLMRTMGFITKVTADRYYLESDGKAGFAPGLHFGWDHFIHGRIVNSADLSRYWADELSAIPVNERYYRAGAPARNVALSLLNTVLYLALAWYLGQVSDTGNGAPKRWHFFLTRAYWGLDREKEASFVDGDTLAKVRDESARAGSVRFHKVSKTFKDVTALKELSVELRAGEVFCLLGKNGAGKSTFLSILSGQVAATHGKVFVRGLSSESEMDAIRPLLGLCPQDDVLWPDLTAIEHLRFYARFRGIPASRAVPEIEALLKDVGLARRGESRVSTFSGGMKRRLSFAIACVGSPPLILLDEPSTGLDPLALRRTWRLISRLKEGRVILLTTHSMDEADALGDRVGMIANGTVRALGTPVFLKNRFGSGYQAKLVCSDSGVETLRELIQRHLPHAEILDASSGSLAVAIPRGRSSSHVPAFFRLVDAHGMEHGGELIREWGISASTLEEVFLRLAREHHAVNEDVSGLGDAGHDDDDDLARGEAARAPPVCILCKERPSEDVVVFTSTGLPAAVSNLICSVCSPPAPAMPAAPTPAAPVPTPAAPPHGPTTAPVPGTPATTHGGAESRVDEEGDGTGNPGADTVGIHGNGDGGDNSKNGGGVIGSSDNIGKSGSIDGDRGGKAGAAEGDQSDSSAGGGDGYEDDGGGDLGGVDGAADRPAGDSREGAEGGPSTAAAPAEPREGSPQEGSPQEGSPQEGSPRVGSPQEGSPQEGSPQEGSPQEGSPRVGSPRVGSAAASIEFKAPRPMQALLGRSWSIKKRQKKTNVVQILLPIVIMSLLVIMKLAGIIVVAEEEVDEVTREGTCGPASPANPDDVTEEVFEARQNPLCNMDAFTAVFVASSRYTLWLNTTGSSEETADEEIPVIRDGIFGTYDGAAFKTGPVIWVADEGGVGITGDLPVNGTQIEVRSFPDGAAIENSFAEAQRENLYSPVPASILPDPNSLEVNVAAAEDWARSHFPNLALVLRDREPVLGDGTGAGGISYTVMRLMGQSREHGIFRALSVPSVEQAPSSGTSRVTMMSDNVDMVYSAAVNFVHNAELRRVAGPRGYIATGFAEFQPMQVQRTNDGVSSLLAILLSVLITFAVTFTFPTMVSTAVYEKEQRAFEMMRMMGVRPIPYWGAQYLFNFSQQVIVDAVLLIYARVAGIPPVGSVVEESLSTRAGPFAVLLLCWSHALVCLSILFIALFSSSGRAASLFSYAFVILSVLGGLLALMFSDEIPTAALLFPPFAFMEGSHALLIDRGASVTAHCTILFFGGIACAAVGILSNEIATPSSPLRLVLYGILDRVRGTGPRRSHRGAVAGPGGGGESARGAVRPAGADVEMVEIGVDDGEDVDIADERARAETGDPARWNVVLRNLRKVYDGVGSRGNLASRVLRRGPRKKHVAVSDLSLAIPPGECFAILGPNGAGKSTTFSMLFGTLRPESGDAWIGGHSVVSEPMLARSSVGIVQQHDCHWAELSVQEHLLFYARLAGVTRKCEAAAVQRAAEIVSLDGDPFHKPSSTLSGGQRRLLSLGTACVHSPAVILLDEPTTGLSPLLRRTAWQVISDLKKKCSIVISSHSMQESEAVADRIGIMTQGKLACVGDSLHLKSRFGSGFSLSVQWSDAEGAREALDAICEENLPPGSRLASTVAGVCTYAIPRGSRITEIIEAISSHTHAWCIEEWSFSQATLGDVFNAVAEGREDDARDDDDEGLTK